MEVIIPKMEEKLEELESSFSKMDVNTKSIKTFSELHVILEKVKKGEIENYTELIERFNRLTTELTERKDFLEKSYQRLQNIALRFANYDIDIVNSYIFAETDLYLTAIKGADTNDQEYINYSWQTTMALSTIKELENLANKIDEVMNKLKMLEHQFCLFGVNIREVPDYQIVEDSISIFKEKILSIAAMEIITQKIEPALNRMESTIVFYNSAIASLNELFSKMPADADSISIYKNLLNIIESQKDLGIGKISSQEFIERMQDYSTKATEESLDNKKDNTDRINLITYFLQESKKANDLIISSFDNGNSEEQDKETTNESLITYLLSERQKAYDLILSSFSHEPNEELSEGTPKQSLIEYFLEENKKAYETLINSFQDDSKPKL